MNKKLFLESLNNVNTFDEWNEKVSKIINIKNKGDVFEYFTYYILKYHNEFKNKYKEVYLYNDIPINIKNKLSLPNIDKGIDLLCISHDNGYYSVQCKFRSNREEIIPWNELSTFAGFFKNEYIIKGLLFTNCYNVCEEMTNTNKIINVYGVFFENDRIGNDFIINLRKKVESEIDNKIYNLPLINKYKPLYYQNEIIESGVKHFNNNSKGLLSMACGTGKTLTSYFIINELNYNKIIIVVPSLILLSQMYSTYSKQEDYETLLIGSDTETYIKNVPGIEIETNYKNILIWLKNHKKTTNKQLIITTYQSSFLIKDALTKLKITFDICIYDEAHKTVGTMDKCFSTLLDDTFNVNKRLFMTATPKIYKGINEYFYCMDDENIYGKKFYELNMRKAINDKLLTDYKIITPITTNNQLLEYIKYKNLVNLNHNIKYIEESKSLDSNIIDDICEENIIENIIENLPDNNKRIINDICEENIIENLPDNNKIIINDICEEELSDSLEFEDEESNEEYNEELSDSLEFEDDASNEESEDDELSDSLESNEESENSDSLESENDEFSNIIYNSNEVVSAIMLCKLLQNDVNVSKVLTYHNNVNSAIRFSKLLYNVKSIFNLENLYINTLDGKSSMKNRQKIINEFIFNTKSIICSARVLNEGVDIKEVDSVMFVNSRKSVIDIIQCIGRCLRLYNGKSISNIIIPTIYEEDEKNTQFQNIFNIIKGLSSQDENIVAYFREKNSKGYSDLINWNNVEICEEINFPIKINLSDLYSNLEYKIWYNQDNWQIIYNLVEQFIIGNKRRPMRNSKNSDEKRLGQFISNQNNNYKKQINSMQTIERRNLWDSLKNKYKEYLSDSDNKWKNNYDLIEKFIIENKRKPMIKSKKLEEQKLGIFISEQNKNYKKQIKSMQTIERQNLWDNLKNKYKDYLSDTDEKWHNNYDLVEQFIIENKRKPMIKSKKLEEQRLGIFISEQNKNYKKQNKSMKPIERRNLWYNLKNKYKEYFITSDENFQNNYDLVEQFIIINKRKPVENSKNNEEKKLGKFISHQITNYNKQIQSMQTVDRRNLWDEFKIKYKDYFMSDDENFQNNYELVEKFFNENKRKPSERSKNLEEKRLGIFISNQNTNYKKQIQSMQTVDRRNLWVEFKNKYIEYFISDDEKWEINYNLVEQFITVNKKLPSSDSKNLDEKKLGSFISHQITNYKKQINSMKTIERRNLWDELKNKYKVYLSDNDDNWKINYNLVEQFIIFNKKIPSKQSKDNDEKKLGSFITNQNINYKKQIKSMKTIERRNLWDEFKNKYKEYFISDDENWQNNYNLIEKFIITNKKRPSEKSKNLEEKRLGQFISHQNTNYKKQIKSMKTIEKRDLWDNLKK